MMTMNTKVGKDVGNLFNQSIDEDYYKPIITNSAFNSNYIEYESKGDKDKTSSIKEYFNIIRPYLSDIINNHKTQGEWKTQLTMTILYLLKILIQFILQVQKVIIQKLWWVMKQIKLLKNFFSKI